MPVTEFNQNIILQSLSFISDVRQVPDNQEVFTHSRTDQSMIIEILEFAEGADEDAVKYVFESAV